MAQHPMKIHGVNDPPPPPEQPIVLKLEPFGPGDDTPTVTAYRGGKLVAKLLSFIDDGNGVYVYRWSNGGLAAAGFKDDGGRVKDDG